MHIKLTYMHRQKNLLPATEINLLALRIVYLCMGEEDRGMLMIKIIILIILTKYLTFQ